MLKNHVVLEKLGISWTLAMCLLVGAAVLCGLSAMLFAILFKHTKASVRRLSKDEAAMVALYARTAEIQPGPVPVIVGAHGMTGAAAELKIDIDSLRNAARRGDWMTFWIWPIMLTGFVSGVGAALAAGLVAAGEGQGFLMILLLGFVGLFVSFVWFMPWAAVYTKIDLGTAGAGTTPGGSPSGLGRSPRSPER